MKILEIVISFIKLFIALKNLNNFTLSIDSPKIVYHITNESVFIMKAKLDYDFMIVYFVIPIGYCLRDYKYLHRVYKYIYIMYYDVLKL